MQLSAKTKVILFSVALLDVALICVAAINLTRAEDYSRRLRYAESKLDRAVEQLTAEQQRSAQLANNIGVGISELKESIGDGTKGISERIRAAAKAVEAMETTLSGWYTVSSNNNGDSRGSN